MIYFIYDRKIKLYLLSIINLSGSNLNLKNLKNFKTSMMSLISLNYDVLLEQGLEVGYRMGERGGL